TFASGGPPSISTLPPGAWNSVASPWPTSRNVAVKPRGTGATCGRATAAATTPSSTASTAAGSRARGIAIAAQAAPITVYAAASAGADDSFTFQTEPGACALQRAMLAT